MTNQLPVLEPEDRVLSTLESDGSRRWLYPRLAKGRFWAWRRVVAYALIALYALLPFIAIGGKPAILLDLPNREFTFFGFTFLPTDTVLLAVFVVMLFLGIFFVTAIAGRVWCGWACPQTVYLEFVFRPIERFFSGRAGKGGAPDRKVAGPWRALMYLAYFLVCLHLANVFLAYFVGAEQLHRWIWSSSPWKHPGPFALVAFITALMMFDFCYWREQLCIIGCPYGRFQSVMLDRSSAIIGYDERRGEPRGRGRDRAAAGLGDCVDCSMCVAVCPTGIDIRDGLQLECVGCAQCIDACDAVMQKVGLPQGLIRYSSQSALAGRPIRVLRPRVVAYAAIIFLLAGAFVTMIATKSPFDVDTLRNVGRPYRTTESGLNENTFRLILENRTHDPHTYSIAVEDPASVEIAGGPLRLSLEPRERITEPLRLLTSPSAFRRGELAVTILVTDDGGNRQTHRMRLIGDVAPPTAADEGESP
ncbi:putative electron transport protein YccM [Posidoniimonas corsicana]|uniref:Putative electron transport protein YccM n=1 Tax=Posidoniimonas corsicana TaxID=1938618 RepID=A0A5C5UT78_9BACT|nr:cytochrome c oxidase accessory protein CcoG [Posidoniimonas corsicana]TWT29396.1 putative electron transport protein YccM [Posidoniimonas corsicana]